MDDKPLIEQVLEITSGDRRRDYGRPLINHLRIAIAWSNYLQTTITPDKVVWMMIALKTARETHTPKFDNLLDTVGYALCLDDMYAQLVELKWATDRDTAMQVTSVMTVPTMQSLLAILQETE